jgi:glycolate oxidase FAD binding subunit
MDGKGQDLSFGGKVMKNVAGYDVSRLMPGSMGTLALLLDASVKVLPRAAATTTLRCRISQARALQLTNKWAGQPLPLSASSWIGSPKDVDGELTIRLAGAAAAVKAAIPLMGAATTLTELDPKTAEEFWRNLREQQLPAFQNLNGNDTLYRLALPAACEPLTIPGVSNEIVLEWHGQQRWIKAAGDDATFASIKTLANTHGGHATRFKQGASIDPTKQRFTLLSEQAHSVALEKVQERLRSAFDPAGVFATKRLP